MVAVGRNWSPHLSNGTETVAASQGGGNLGGMLCENWKAQRMTDCFMCSVSMCMSVHTCVGVCACMWPSINVGHFPESHYTLFF